MPARARPGLVNSVRQPFGELSGEMFWDLYMVVTIFVD